MNLPDFDYQVVRLSNDFYNKYNTKDYPEIVIKESRCYNCLLVDSHYDYFICIPFRSNVKHRNAFHFKNSKRSRNHNSALDYSKIVIINKLEYIDKGSGIVDEDEYREIRFNIRKIVREAIKYVEEYKKVINSYKDDYKESKDFERKYKYTSLKYFHKELGILYKRAGD